MKKYIVVFARCPADVELRIGASRSRYKTLREARNYADRYTNAFIVRTDDDGNYHHCKTRADLRALKHTRS